jgi:hypothetical protein
VVGVEVTDDDGVDLGRIDAGFLPSVILGDVASRRSELGSRARIEQHELAFRPDRRDREGNRHVRVCEAAGLEGSFDLVNRGIFHKAGIVSSFVDAVVHLDDFDVADLEFDDIARRFLRERRGEKLQRSVEAERGSRCRSRNHKPTP